MKIAVVLCALSAAALCHPLTANAAGDAPSVVPKAALGDKYEPDNEPTEATAVACGETQTHTVDVDGDVDWFSISLTSGDTLTVETGNLSGAHADTVLDLFDSDCQFLSTNDDGGGGLASLLEWTATASGTYLVKAYTYSVVYGACNGEWGGVADCTYDIAFSCGFCCDPPFTPGERVSLLVDNPGGAVDLMTGHCGTVVCCDSDNRDLPILVSWDRWSQGHNDDAPCSELPLSYPDSSAWWVTCDQMQRDETCGPCAPPPVPGDPTPPSGATNIPLDPELCWNGAGKTAKVIYGADDRLDIYEVEDAAQRAAAASTVALVYASDLSDNGDGTFSLPAGPTLAEFLEYWAELPICPGEPYPDQPVPAFCSGALVAPDLVVTAGHCITNGFGCGGTAFVFGFDMTDATTPVLTFPASDVYWCQSIVERIADPAGADWGVIQLDRPVTGHDSLRIRRVGKVPDGSPLLMIGHPVGLPTKIVGGAMVRYNTPSAYFEANVDAYGGNSGSAVLNAETLRIEGLLVRGNPDFVIAGGCVASNQCPDTGCPSSGWEEITRATEFANLIPGGDEVEYEILFERCDGLAKAMTSHSADPCWTPPSPLETNIEYCWQVTAKSECGETVGPRWSFTTASPLSILSSEPPDCAIDARQPSEPNGDAPDGWDSIDLVFSGSVAEIPDSDFDAHAPYEATPLPICGFDRSGETVTVHLCDRIARGTWACVRYVPTGQEVCLSHLPADVNNDGVSTSADTPELINHLNDGVSPPYEVWQCDVDRSGDCAAQDILRVIDLLNGADLYEAWLDVSVPACPSPG